MPRYRVLRSVAHNIGHSFTSLMNYAHDDYVMGHILRLARLTGKETLTIDFVEGAAGPPELLADPISDIPSRYSESFWNLVQRHGSDRSLIKAAILTLRFDTSVNRQRSTDTAESPYVCDVCITDVRGKNHTAHFQGWWYPERVDSSKKTWWKFWER
jgi:hypothetical protein